MQRRPLIALVTRRHRYGTDEAEAREALTAAVRSAAMAGVDFIQVREPDLDDRRLLTLTRCIVEGVRGTSCRVVVNARADVAVAAGAHGVHLRGFSPPAPRVRAIVGREFVIGRSVHSADEAAEVERDGGCDYLIFGTVFTSGSKRPDHPVAGVETLARVCATVRLPVLAIGGVTLDRVATVAAAGAGGLAGIDLFAAAWTGSAERDAGAHFGEIITGIRRVFGANA